MTPCFARDMGRSPPSARRRSTILSFRMFRGFVAVAVIFLSGFACAADLEEYPLAKRNWFEARTLHFTLYSCAPTQEVARIGARLEQFREAYSGLAGSQAVSSPP